MDSFPVEEEQRRAPVFCISADDEALFEGFKVFSALVKQEINDLGLVLRYTVCEVVESGLRTSFELGLKTREKALCFAYREERMRSKIRSNYKLSAPKLLRVPEDFFVLKCGTE